MCVFGHKPAGTIDKETTSDELVIVLVPEKRIHHHVQSLINSIVIQISYFWTLLITVSNLLTMIIKPL